MRGASAPGSPRNSASRRYRGTLPPCPRTTRRWTNSASAAMRDSRCGTGSADATRSGRPSGLSLELAIGTAHFEAMLAGARAMDEHFRNARMARQPARAARTARALEPERAQLRQSRRAAVQPAPGAASGLPPATRNGEPRQARDAQWQAGRRPDRSRDLGRAGLQCPAFLLPAAAPGNGRGQRRFPVAALGRGRRGRRRARDRELPGAGSRLHERSRLARPAPRPPGQPAALADRVSAPRSAQRSAQSSRSTSTRYSSNPCSGTSIPSTNGASSSARRSAQRCCRSVGRNRRRSSPALSGWISRHRRG